MVQALHSTNLVQWSNGPRKRERFFSKPGIQLTWSNGWRKKERDFFKAWHSTNLVQWSKEKRERFFQSLAFNLLGPMVQRKKREIFFKTGHQLTWSNGPMVQGKKQLSEKRRKIFFRTLNMICHDVFNHTYLFSNNLEYAQGNRCRLW